MMTKRKQINRLIKLLKDLPSFERLRGSLALLVFSMNVGPWFAVVKSGIGNL